MPRVCCNACGNAVASCICKWIYPIYNKTSVVILQHTDEAKKPLGTAKIVSLCLQNSMLKVGVDFSSDPDLKRLLNCPSHNLSILYPSESALELHKWKEGNASSEEQILSASLQKALIVLDGTWRNTRELMNVNPVLQTIPSVKLTPTTKSNYRIRKAPFDQALSTVEAVSQALNILEPEISTDAMNQCFENMIDYQISRMGKSVYYKNYIESSGQLD